MAKIDLFQHRRESRCPWNHSQRAQGLSGRIDLSCKNSSSRIKFLATAVYASKVVQTKTLGLCSSHCIELTIGPSVAAEKCKDADSQNHPQKAVLQQYALGLDNRDMLADVGGFLDVLSHESQ
jgi:hypothetical protein